MKRKLCIISITVLIMFCLAITSMADTVVQKPQVSFNDDFTKMYYNGKTFSRIDASMLEYDFNYDEIINDVIEYDDGVYTDSYSVVNETDEYTVTPNPAHTFVEDIYVYADIKEVLFFADITYKDGAYLSCSYLRDDYTNEYNKIIAGDTEQVTIDFIFPDGNTVICDSAKLKTGTPAKARWNYESFCVYSYTKDNVLRAEVGQLFYENDKFYYFDYAKEGITSEDFYSYEYDEILPVTEVTDEALKAEIEIAVQEYYNDDMGFVFNDDLSESISKVFYSVLFLLIPLAVCIGSLILFIKAKKPIYKKIFATICVLSLLVIITTVIIVIQYNKIVTV